MIRKKHGGKKRSTYKPKFAKKFRDKPHKKQETQVPVTEDGFSIIPKPVSSQEKIKVAKESLPESYHPVDNEAYAFPPFAYVIGLLIVLGIVAYLLF